MTLLTAIWKFNLLMLLSQSKTFFSVREEDLKFLKEDLGQVEFITA
jgi:hypothetical protein